MQCSGTVADGNAWCYIYMLHYLVPGSPFSLRMSSAYIMSPLLVGPLPRHCELMKDRDTNKAFIHHTQVFLMFLTHTSEQLLYYCWLATNPLLLKIDHHPLIVWDPENYKRFYLFIGGYKVLTRLLPGYATSLAPLMTWSLARTQCAKSEPCSIQFCPMQHRLHCHKFIVLPRSNNYLWITTDSTRKSHGIGATLHITHNGKPMLSCFFTAKLFSCQHIWIPCDIEDLSIIDAVKHHTIYYSFSAQGAWVDGQQMLCSGSPKPMQSGVLQESKSLRLLVLDL